MWSIKNVPFEITPRVTIYGRPSMLYRWNEEETEKKTFLRGNGWRVRRWLENIAAVDGESNAKSSVAHASWLFLSFSSHPNTPRFFYMFATWLFTIHPPIFLNFGFYLLWDMKLWIVKLCDYGWADAT